MDNRPGIQAATHCEITIMHNIQHKEDATKLINVANKSLNPLEFRLPTYCSMLYI